MLTIDKLKGVELLKELTPEQLEVIENMSKQDENEVIGEKTKLFYDNLDKDILDITGIPKPDNVKTYEHNKKVLSDYKSKAEANQVLEAKALELKKVNQELQEKVKQGITDTQLKADYDKLKASYNSLEALAKAKDEEYTKARQDLESKQKQFFINSKINEVVGGLQLKHDERLNKLVVENAKNNILGKYKIDITEDNQVEIYDTEGKQKFNPATYKPMGLKELFESELAADLKTSTIGLGLKNNPPKNISFLGEATNRGEAQENIRNYLIKEKGLVKDSQEYIKEWKEILNTSDYQALPLE